MSDSSEKLSANRILFLTFLLAFLGPELGESQELFVNLAVEDDRAVLIRSSLPECRRVCSIL